MECAGGARTDVERVAIMSMRVLDFSIDLIPSNGSVSFSLTGDPGQQSQHFTLSNDLALHFGSMLQVAGSPIRAMAGRRQQPAALV